MYEAEMSDDKKLGVTHSIRERLNFLDERLWKKFSARRLELIDTLDLSLKKASEQEDEIKKVAEILRLEFDYSLDYFPDFDKLVRAAVQSVRRNRKRSTKTRRNMKKRRLSSENGNSDVHMKDESIGESPTSDRSHFLAEISRLNTDGQEVYDLSYSRQKQFTSSDHSRAAIDLIIQPVNLDTRAPHLGVLLPPISGGSSALQLINSEKELLQIRQLLLLLMKRSKLCFELTKLANSDYIRVLGRLSLAAITAMVFDKLFSALNQTSVEYLQEKVSLTGFLALFYRGLEPDSAATQSLDDETASLTLQTLIGCCIKDFGFDRVLFPVGEAIFRSILLEYPLVLKLSVPFLRSEMEAPQNPDADLQPDFQTSLLNLATVALELSSHMPQDMQGVRPAVDVKSENSSRKLVILKFLLSLLEFTYPMKGSAPPRLVELMENAKQAFKLNDNQIFALRNQKTSQVVNSDFDLERIFETESNIELEIFPQRFQAIPIYELTSAVTSTKYSDDSPKIILPPPIQPSPLISRPLSAGFARPMLPKFQPLL